MGHRGVELRSVGGLSAWRFSKQCFGKSVDNVLLMHYIKSRDQLELLHRIFTGEEAGHSADEEKEPEDPPSGISWVEGVDVVKGCAYAVDELWVAETILACQKLCEKHFGCVAVRYDASSTPGTARSCALLRERPSGACPASIVVRYLPAPQSTSN